MESSETGTEVDLGSGTPLRRLVVPLTLDHGFDRGVSMAARLAEHWHLPILLVSVAEEPGTANQAIEEQRASLLAAHPSVQAGVELVGAGATPAQSLTEALDDGDLIVIATEAAGEDGSAPSFAQELTYAWGGPVLMIGPAAQIDAPIHGDVVVGLDGSAMAERGLPLAIGLAAALDSQVWAVQVVPSATTDEIERLRARGEHVSESAYIRDALDRANSRSAAWEIVHGDDPAHSLTELVRDRDAAFLVLATHGQSALPRAVFGNVCMAMVRHSPRPVLVVSPTAAKPAAS